MDSLRVCPNRDVEYAIGLGLLTFFEWLSGMRFVPAIGWCRDAPFPATVDQLRSL